MRKRTDVLSGILIVVLLLGFFLALRSGVVVDFLSYDCRRAANAMLVNYMWDPLKGCFIQQANGVWTPIDVNSNLRHSP